MAWYSGTFACGHEGRVNVVGPTKKRDWLIEYKFSGLCPDCYRKKLEEEREKKNQEAAEKAREMDLPELEGTEKQIAWANTLRQEFIDKCMKWFDDFSDIGKEAFYFILENKTKASWYIENRYHHYHDVLEKVAKELKEQKEKERTLEAEIEAEVKAETIVRPEKPVTETIVEITFDDSHVYAKFPVKRDDFWKLIKKKMGYTWDSKWSRWVRALSKQSGSPIDRAAELGHTLLAHGFIVCIGDPEVREKAINGTFEPEHTRWIFARTKGEYEGWFVIEWNRDKEDYYEVARRITRSKYSKPGVVVPPEIYEEVLDFAERYDFRFSEGATRLIENSRKIKESAIVVNIEKQSEQKVIASTEIPELDVPEEVTIDESLRDDD